MEIVRIGEARVDFSRLTIEGKAGRYTAEPKVLDVLQALLDQRGKVVSREALIDQVWGVAYGGDERLSRAISLLRKALGDRRSKNRHIETIPKRGYRLRTWAQGSAASPDRFGRSLAVLPFANLSPDQSTGFLADGLCLDMTNLLSRVPSQRVAPYSSAIRYSGEEKPLQDIACELGVRFLTTGTFQAQGHDIRLRASVVEAQTGQNIWAQKYTAKLDQFFEVQDEIVLAIATSINSEVEVAGLKTILDRPDFNLTAYEHIQAAEAERWTYNRDAADRIVAHLRAALEIDPDNASAHAALTVQLGQNITSLWTDDPVVTFAEAEEHLQKAQSIAPNLPDVLTAAGILATMTGRADQAVPPLARAVELDPNNPHSRAVYGWQLCLLERDPAGVELIRTAEQEAPHHPRYANWASYRGHAELRLGNYEASLEALEEAVLRNPNYHQVRIARAWPLMLMGRMEEASEKIREGLEIESHITVDQSIAAVERFVFQIPPGTTMEEFVELLREVWPK